MNASASAPPGLASISSAASSAACATGASEELFLFYRCHRATLRARLAIAHLLEPNPRTPEKWPRLARVYLRIAAADSARLERLAQNTRRSLSAAPSLQPPDRLGEKRRRRQDVDLVARSAALRAETPARRR